jgi:hypothetical protein
LLITEGRLSTEGSSLKALGHEMNIFEGIKIKEVIKVKFLLESFKILANS